MHLLDELAWRGLVHQVTDPEVAREALSGHIRAYIGFDPSAASLHIGSLLPILTLRRLQLAGHTPIALVGGGTGIIGDPSGKSAERKLLDADTAKANALAIRHQVEHFLDKDGPNPAVFIDNLEWLGEVRLLDFLRDFGKHFSVNAMVQRDSVKKRLEERDHGISFTEFSYMLLQAYDFWTLWRDHGCRAQLGGSDQWGNIVSGIDLIGRLAREDGADAGAPFGVTMPLVTTRSGQKFGKTEAGAIWLDPKLTTPYRFYQFWINVEDADVGMYLRYFTFLSREAVETLEARHALAPHLREAQRTLAHEVTMLVHGEAETVGAEQASMVLFGGDPREAPLSTFAMLAGEIPYQDHPALTDQTLATVLVGETEMHPFRSNGEAKRALQAGSVSWNGVKLGQDLQAPIAGLGLLHHRLGLVRVGKKQYYLTRFS
jgi:tyrosyl-tRNA synthetase